MQILSDSEVKLIEADPKFAEELYEVIDRNRSAMTNLVWVQEATLESTRAFLLAASTADNEMLRLIVNNGQIVGTVTLRDTESCHQMLGYWLDDEAQGRGIAAEAVRQILRESDSPVVAHIRVANTRSQAVVERVGFVPSTIDTTWITYVYAR